MEGFLIASGNDFENRFLTYNKGTDKMNSTMTNSSMALFLILIFISGSPVFITSVSAETFVYDKTPAFTVSFPDEFKESEDKGNSVYKARGNTTSLSISVSELKEDAKLENAAEYYANSLRKIAREGTEVKIIYADKKTLTGGTPVMEFEIKWETQGGTPLVTQAIMFFKDQKLITMGFHNWGEPIGTKPFYTLTFK
ncbi:MAG: hypothetical protein ISS66_17695 [Desulfobacteraceae bacterium]|nr:hypothetical protein [Desulfobacteraceae bacterium]